MNATPSSEQEQRAAWRLHVAVHGVLSGLVLRPVDTCIQPDAVVLGDIDDAAMVLNEPRPALSTRHGDLLAQIQRGIGHARGRRVTAATELLLEVWEPLSRLSGGRLELPVPPPATSTRAAPRA